MMQIFTRPAAFILTTFNSIWESTITISRATMCTNVFVIKGLTVPILVVLRSTVLRVCAAAEHVLQPRVCIVLPVTVYVPNPLLLSQSSPIHATITPHDHCAPQMIVTLPRVHYHCPTLLLLLSMLRRRLFFRATIFLVGVTLIQRVVALV